VKVEGIERGFLFARLTLRLSGAVVWEEGCVADAAFPIRKSRRSLGSREPEYIALALRIRGLLATALRVPFTQIHPATKFRDLFSMEFDGAAVDLLITIETVFSLQIPGDVVEHIETVEDLARYLYTVRRSAPSNDCD